MRIFDTLLTSAGYSELCGWFITIITLAVLSLAYSIFKKTPWYMKLAIIRSKERKKVYTDLIFVPLKNKK